ncbi:MAG: hypothetical protein ACT4OX_02670 [Actinomycetota bacterium]
MSPAQLARRNRSDLEAMFVAFLALVLAIGTFAALGAAFDDDYDGVPLAADRASDAPREARLAVATESSDEHADGHDATAAGAGHAEGDDHGHDATAASASHGDGDDHGHDAAAGAGHAESEDHGHDATAAGAGHAEGDDHGHDATAAGATRTDDHAHDPAAPGAPPTDNHAHDPAPSGTGPTVPHDDGHSHTPPPTGTGTGDTTPTTSHDHGPPPTTVPGQPTPTTDPHDHTDGPNVQLAQLPADIQARINAATQWALQYPTVAQAPPGYPRLTAYFPGIAAHFVNINLLFDNQPFNPALPEVLLYNGTGPNAKLVGINYIVFGGDNPPEGFPGNYDGWHEHANLCLRNGIVIGEVPAGQVCPAGQTTFSFKGYWLLHVWSIPGWESPDGIFSHYNSKV